MKKFLVVGNFNALSYSYFFPLLLKGVSVGYNDLNKFQNPDNDIIPGPPCRWFSNLDIDKRYSMELAEKYDPEKYSSFDNYPALNVDRVSDIPVDYDGEMGVPITILDKMDNKGMLHFNNDYKVIAGFNDFKVEKEGYVLGKPVYISEKEKRWAGPVLKGKRKYARVIIKKV